MSIRKYYYINNLLIGIILITLIQVPFFNQNLTNNTSEEMVINKEITSYNCHFSSNTRSSIYPQAIFNDIASASILCYLHLITTQVQLDINFVGSNSLIESSSEVKTVLEEIVIFSKIRSVQVVESDAINLDHTELFVGNITYIQFQLSSEIPIGVLRNVKITFIQDTYDFLTHYNYILGVNWQRLIGNQNVAIICDMGVSLLECKPLPHSITTVSNKLVLSWLEVNKQDFYASMNYTSIAIIDELEITPSNWDFGKIKKTSTPLEMIFTLTNNENMVLGGEFSCPEGLESNVTNWALNIGETMYVRIRLNINQVGFVDKNITISFSFAAFPIMISVTGEITKILGPTSISLVIVSSSIIVVGSFFIIRLIRKRQLILKNIQLKEIQESDDEIIKNIDLAKWKEILTNKEFLIFNYIVERRQITQANLCRMTSLSKSTVSRAVGRLEVKGLIKKENYGMSNIITINLEFFQK